LADGGGRQDAADSTFHSFQLTSEKRFSKGLAFLTAYTYSHSIDDAVGGSPQNVRNLSADRGNSDFDVRHRGVFSWTYELPVGKGKGFLGNIHGVSDVLVSHWQLNGIVTLMSGQYFTPISGTNTLGAGGGTQRPDAIRNGNLPASQ